MLTKPQKSRLHLVLEILRRRGEFSNEKQSSLNRLSSGYEGELNFYTILKENLRTNPIQLFDLHIEVNGSECQIDALLMFANELVVCEVKNYQGDFIINNGDWFTLTNQEIRNPLHQLDRTKILLQQYLKKHNLSFAVNPYVVFVHPEFHLYQAPVNTPIIFLPQIFRFMKQLENIPCKLHSQHKKLEKLLTTNHQSYSSRSIIPNYSYASLRKGILCKKCNGTMKEVGRKYTICLRCSSREEYDKAVKRNIKDFTYLFPDKKINVKTVAEWLDHQTSSFRIRTHLSRKFNVIHSGKCSYYVFKNDVNNA